VEIVQKAKKRRILRNEPRRAANKTEWTRMRTDTGDTLGLFIISFEIS
jgi:hypothetical protein